MKEILFDSYQFVLEEKLLNEIAAIGRLKSFARGSTIIDIGDALQFMPLVLQGAVKVVNEDEKGNEFLLYYLEVGDSCSMTMTCCLGDKKSIIRAVVEEHSILCLVPNKKMEEWLIRYKSWRKFVFDSYDIRLNEMLDAINSVVFNNMEERLYKYLKDRSMVLRTATLEITHRQIANDLNTSRVVISRLIKKLQLENKITANRNLITLPSISSRR